MSLNMLDIFVSGLSGLFVDGPGTLSDGLSRVISAVTNLLISMMVDIELMLNVGQVTD